jgi:hypothetical protein
VKVRRAKEISDRELVSRLTYWLLAKYRSWFEAKQRDPKGVGPFKLEFPPLLPPSSGDLDRAKLRGQLIEIVNLFEKVTGGTVVTCELGSENICDVTAQAHKIVDALLSKPVSLKSFVEILDGERKTRISEEEKEILKRRSIDVFFSIAKILADTIGERECLKALENQYLKVAHGPALYKTRKAREALALVRKLQTARTKRDKLRALKPYLDALSNDPDFCNELPGAIKFLNRPKKAKAWLVEHAILQGSKGKYTRSEVRRILGITDRALRKICRELRENNVLVPFKQDRVGRRKASGRKQKRRN